MLSFTFQLQSKESKLYAVFKGSALNLIFWLKMLIFLKEHVTQQKFWNLVLKFYALNYHMYHLAMVVRDFDQEYDLVTLFFSRLQFFLSSAKVHFT